MATVKDPTTRIVVTLADIARTPDLFESVWNHSSVGVGCVDVVPSIRHKSNQKPPDHMTAVLHKELESIDSSVLYLVLRLAWYLMVGGVSEKGSNGVEDGWPGDPSQPMRWMMGVSMNSD
ncbi:hypothetical protein TNCV_1460181 [Trichonephila clavipes]|nr:hypothetical protein TNCV_1460181 [Trichonephila clavipes]